MLLIEKPNCPQCQAKARGTIESLAGIGLLRFEDETVDHDAEADWGGETEVCWDGQRTRRDEDGKVTLVCDDGHEWQSNMTDLLGEEPAELVEEPKTSVLDDLADAQRKISNQLFSNKDLPCFNVKDNKSCLMQEDDRPLDKEEKRAGWSQRPFWAYRQVRLCNSCRAYWFAEQAAQVLHEIRCWEARTKAQEEAKQEVKP